MNTKNLFLLLPAALMIFCLSCGGEKKQSDGKDKLYIPKAENFDTTINGKQVKLYTLKNKNGLELYTINYGLRVISLFAPDKNGQFADIVLGYKTIDEYMNDNNYFGGVVGRYANRVAFGKFTMDKKNYQLTVNSKQNMLHGGKYGFDKVVWDVVNADSNSITFSYVSPDMEEGFPGTVTVKVKYTLTDDNEFKIEYEATTDKNTIINLAQHSYFNLRGEGDPTILDQILEINAANITPVDTMLIPSGELMPVENTPFDFRTPKAIGLQIGDTSNAQIKVGPGYDHNWVLTKDSTELSLAARMSDTASGRVLEVYTTEPGLQFYSGNFLNGTSIGKSGKPYMFRSAVALETQHFPDSPNQPNFPSTILKPGEKYTHTCIYKLLVATSCKK